MRSFIKVMGPPLLKAVRELKIAVDMPQVCVMDEAYCLMSPVQWRGT